MSLNDTQIRSLKPSEKPFKISDSHGLYLLVNPGGSRLWYLKYRINRKESRLGLGAYPDVSLADARLQRDGIRKLLAQNINPAQQRCAERATSSPEKTFKYVALDWHKSNRTWSENHAARLLASMNNHIFPVIGHLPISELKPRHFIDLLKGIEQKGLLEVAARTRQHMCNIMRHAIHQELIENNPAANLDGIISVPVKHHYPALQLERLTSDGIAVVLTPRDVLFPARFEPSKITGWTLEHHLDNQAARIILEQKGASGWINGDRTTFLSSYQISHRPDGLITLPDGNVIAIETERRLKTKARYQSIIASHLLARTRKDWIYVFYIVPDPQKKRGLERLFDSIRHVIVNHQHIPLETRHRNVFRIYTLDELQRLDLDHGI